MLEYVLYNDYGVKQKIERCLLEDIADVIAKWLDSQPSGKVVVRRSTI